MERTVQVLAAHCVLKLSSDIVASPGTNVAPALSTDWGQQHQHILTPASAKDAPAQRQAPHCSICGAARRTHRHTHAHMRAHTHIHSHTLTRMRTHIQTNAREYTKTRTHTFTCTHTYTRARIHVRAHTNTHTCICAHTLCA